MIRCPFPQNLEEPLGAFHLARRCRLFRGHSRLWHATSAGVTLPLEGPAWAEALAHAVRRRFLELTNGPPVALFAPKFTRRGHRRRPYETLVPLAEHLKMSVQMPSGPSDYAALAKHVLSDPGLDGKTVIVCWIHVYLPALAKALGVKPEPARWKGSVYDRV